MNVLIKDMSVPTNCTACRFCDLKKNICFATTDHKSTFGYYDERAPFCPIFVDIVLKHIEYGKDETDKLTCRNCKYSQYVGFSTIYLCTKHHTACYDYFYCEFAEKIEEDNKK